MILVTNYKTGIKGEPIENIMPDKRIVFDKNTMTIEINECVNVGVFETIPKMRELHVTKSWFENNIYKNKYKNEN